jgi:DNA invertase Pin-like site-specific DNA recombinase
VDKTDQIQAVGCARVSTSEQAISGLGLAAQESTIRAECERRGWHLVEVVLDAGESGKNLDRPGLRHALELVADRKATVLVASKLDRISRSVLDFAALLEWFGAADASLVALDVGVDTSTPGGRLVANVFASVAEWERDTISARTRDALQAARAQGRQVSRTAVADRRNVAERIRGLREEGWTLQAIADVLNRDSVPTARGAPEWRVSSVQAAAGYRRPRARRPHPELPPLRRNGK